MGAFCFRLPFFGVLVLGIVVVDLLMLTVGYTTGFRFFYNDEGPLEAFQLVILAVAILGFAALILRVKHAAQLIASGAASLCLLFFFRELDTPVGNPVLDLTSSPSFLYLLSAALGTFILIQIHLNRVHISAFLGWLMRIEWWPFLFAGILLVAGDVFEKSHMPLIEEMLELDGYLVIAITAVAAWWRWRCQSKSA